MLLTTGPKSAALSSSLATSGRVSTSRRTFHGLRPRQSSQHGLPDSSAISQPPARASVRLAPLPRRTAWVPTVIAVTKPGKSAGCDE